MQTVKTYKSRVSMVHSGVLRDGYPLDCCRLRLGDEALPCGVSGRGGDSSLRVLPPTPVLTLWFFLLCAPLHPAPQAVHSASMWPLLSEFLGVECSSVSLLL